MRSHRRGTTAAAACAARGGAGTRAPAPPPAPLLPDRPLDISKGYLSGEGYLRLETAAQCAHVGLISERALVRPAIEAALKREDAAAGWKPRSKRPHPTGGYTKRSVRSGAGLLNVVTLVYSNAAGEEHREDGPAIVEYDDQGAVSSATYLRRGAAHRVDGPAVMARNGVGFYLDGTAVPGARSGISSLQRFGALLKTGLERKPAVTWMKVEALIAREMAPSSEHGDRAAAEMVDRLVADDLDPDDALAAWGAGTGGAELAGPDVDSVLRGKVPMSWMSAGL